jgi:hypothetical protein
MTDRWKNRRKMAWLSMLAGLLFPLLILSTESPTLGQIAAPFYVFVGSVVAAYIGFATYDDTHSNNANSSDSKPSDRVSNGLDSERVAVERQD